MSAGELLQRFVAKLDAANIPHMVAGSFASTYHGVPRTTQDIDIVIAPTPAALSTFLSSLPVDDYYVDSDVAREALRRRSLFNVIDMASGWKIDLILRKERPFSIKEFERRELAVILGAKVHVATAEDSIVSKLEWAKQSQSERQLRDVAGIISSRSNSLDISYIQHWVTTLGLDEQWKQVAG
jgi:hypothetical protein